MQNTRRVDLFEVSFGSLVFGEENDVRKERSDGGCFLSSTGQGSKAKAVSIDRPAVFIVGGSEGFIPRVVRIGTETGIVSVLNSALSLASCSSVVN